MIPVPISRDHRRCAGKLLLLSLATLRPTLVRWRQDVKSTKVKNRVREDQHCPRVSNNPSQSKRQLQRESHPQIPRTRNCLSHHVIGARKLFVLTRWMQLYLAPERSVEEKFIDNQSAPSSANTIPNQSGYVTSITPIHRQ